MNFLKEKVGLVIGAVFVLIIYNLIVNSEFRQNLWNDINFFGSESPVSISQPVSTVIPSPSPVPRALLKHLSEKLFMVDLINQARKESGLPPVELGSNVAAQLHAENSLANCFSSHWGLNGLKPYMRYSLAGGYQSNAENGSGSDYCIKKNDGYAPILSVQQKLTQAMDGLMSSSGHRSNILDKSHKKVNIGLAWDKYNISLYQHFEGNYVEYNQLPAIKNEYLYFNGSVKNGVKLDSDEDLGVAIFYDPPPSELTRGQIARTYCYDPGLMVAVLRPPLSPFQKYTEDTFTVTYLRCPNPYKVPKDAPAADSPDEATKLWGEAYYTSEYEIAQEVTGPWITSTNWTARDTLFSVNADIGQVLSRHGSGVYTIVVEGKIDGEDTVISQYSIFYGVTPPDTQSIPTPTPERISAVMHTPTPTSMNTRPAVSPVATPTARPTRTPIIPKTPIVRPTRTHAKNSGQTHYSRYAYSNESDPLGLNGYPYSDTTTLRRPRSSLPRYRHHAHVTPYSSADAH